jgi:hypothetical protein
LRFLAVFLLVVLRFAGFLLTVCFFFRVLRLAGFFAAFFFAVALLRRTIVSFSNKKFYHTTNIDRKIFVAEMQGANIRIPSLILEYFFTKRNKKLWITVVKKIF